MAGSSSDNAITVRAGHLGGLFHSFDPAPFRERELDAEAEKYIMGLATERPRSEPLSIIVQLPKAQGESDIAQILREAVCNHFDYRAEQATRELKELFQEGWRALLIGIPILSASLVAGHMLGRDAAPSSTQWLISESLLILGWVANWRPLEIFLYGWGPIIRRRAVYRRLAAARVEVRFV
jgi:hypothetical protein